ncbi:hypothetical protein AAFF_G00075250 [Aldrovandia affinis]|uniref:Uncharacterized protein n=1 Tax=Aldrovandia affinis TaxID=143900 RepID=A0AAD7WDB5_9TELE|nr:hypothetical protein AAFF_G00075250 [Aldrovandia affinis]
MRRHLKDQVKNRHKAFICKSLGIAEVICTADVATGVKMRVMCGLFGGAMTYLGSPEQTCLAVHPVQGVAEL